MVSWLIEFEATSNLNDTARDALCDLIDRCHDSLNRSGAAGPTDDELLKIAKNVPGQGMCQLWGLPSDWDPGEFVASPEGLVAFAHLVLARWGRPIPEPIQTGSRLPYNTELDSKGRCWYGAPDRPGAVACWDLESEPASDDTHWLPYWALPQLSRLHTQVLTEGP